MAIRIPEFIRHPGLIWPMLKYLFLAQPIDYILGLLGSFAVASITQVSFDLYYGLYLGTLLEWYRAIVSFMLEPFSNSLLYIFRRLFPTLDWNLEIAPVWRDGLVLLGLYYQKHGQNEWASGNRLTAVYQFLAGLIIALAFAVAFARLEFSGVILAGAVFILTFGAAVLTYDAAFLLWSATFLRQKFASKYQRKPESFVDYFASRFREAMERVAIATFVVLVIYLLFSRVPNWQLAGEAINLIMLSIGLAWTSKALRISGEGAKNESEVRFKSLPAGQLGRAVLRPILLGYILTALGVAESALGLTIQPMYGAAGACCT